MTCPGITARLPHLVELGVDAIWCSPFYTSPQNDAGYDVADYRDIDPVFGTLADADELVRQAHEQGVKVIIDLVPNHTSSEHAWFQAALAAGPGSRERARYLFRDGKGEHGEQPPNDWVSVFGGPGWTRVTEADGSPGQWYLHLFDVTQPDLDWTNEEVRAGVRRRPAVLAGPRRRRLPGRRGARPGQGERAAGLPDDARVADQPQPAGPPAPADVGPGRACTRSTSAGARSWTATTATGSWSPRPG